MDSILDSVKDVSREIGFMKIFLAQWPPLKIFIKLNQFSNEELKKRNFY